VWLEQIEPIKLPDLKRRLVNSHSNTAYLLINRWLNVQKLIEVERWSVMDFDCVIEI
jgi:hypothetical protein